MKHRSLVSRIIHISSNTRAKATVITLMFTMAITSLFLSCSSPLGPSFGSSSDADLSNNAGTANSRTVTALAISSIVPAANATNISIGQPVVITFNTTVKTVPSTLITLTDTASGAAIPGRLSIDSSKTKVYYHPIFQTSTEGSGSSATIRISGPKQGRSYRITVNGTVTAENGTTLSIHQTSTYTCTNLDYGIWWFSGTGEAQKCIPGIPNQFYDPSKPVVLYIHGWQKGSVTNNYWREVPYIWNDKYTSNVNTGTFWKQKGYNLGVFYWDQFADEDEVKDAEAKIWVGNNGLKQMRYKLSNGTYVSFSTAQSAGDLLYNAYVEALSGNSSGYIRLVGHSLGNQMATVLTYKAAAAAKNGSLSSALVPKRVYLADPFWSKDAKAYLSNKWTGEVCRTYINYAISQYSVIVEQSKSTAIGGYLVGDENVDMRKMTTFFRIWPDFISITDAALQHSYAVLWYFWSMAGTVQTQNGALGAAAADSTVRSMMNYGKPSYYYWYSSGSGNNTNTSLDDSYIRASGVSTW
ncbi:MAG: Ig-like domain-containing protein [Termitinemataceae bacterium]